MKKFIKIGDVRIVFEADREKREAEEKARQDALRPDIDRKGRKYGSEPENMIISHSGSEPNNKIISKPGSEPLELIISGEESVCNVKKSSRLNQLQD